MNDFFNSEVEQAVSVLRKGGVILYPTDTIWGLGCDATREDAISRIYSIKEREDHKSLIILVADERDIMRYVAAPDPRVFDFLAAQQKATTIIYDQAIGLPSALVAPDGSIAIRIVQDPFCRHLIKRLRQPLVSTSANISGTGSPRFFDEVLDPVKNRVDHIVQWRQDDKKAAQPSQLIRWNKDGSFTVLRS